MPKRVAEEPPGERMEAEGPERRARLPQPGEQDEAERAWSEPGAAQWEPRRQAAGRRAGPRERESREPAGPRDARRPTEDAGEP